MIFAGIENLVGWYLLAFTLLQGTSQIEEMVILPTEEKPTPVVATTPDRTVWDDLAECESNGEWDYGPHSTWGSHLFHGGLQFHPDTWAAFRQGNEPTVAYAASREQQIEVARRVLAEQGWRAWPDCSRRLGLR